MGPNKVLITGVFRSGGATQLTSKTEAGATSKERRRLQKLAKTRTDSPGAPGGTGPPTPGLGW